MAGDEIELGRQRRISTLQLLGFGDNLIGDGLVTFAHCLTVAIDRKAGGASGHEREHGQGCDGGPAPPGSALLALLAGGQEGTLVRVEVPSMAGRPLAGHGQPGTTEQVAGLAALGLPGVGGVGQVAVGPLAGAVLAEPLAQPWPGRQERLVADLDGVPAVGAGVGGQQAGLDQVGEHRPGRSGLRGVRRPGQLGCPGQLGHGDPPAGVRGALAEADQAQQQPPGGLPAVGVEPFVHGLGGAGHGPVDAAGGPVGGHGQPPALPVLPGLLQRVGQQRQSAGLIAAAIR